MVKVGAATETEMKEKKARVEDALHATRAAVEEGIVAGGGVALIRAQAALEKLDVTDEQRSGVNIVRRAIEEPLRQIAANAGEEGSIVVQRVRDGQGSFGYNAATNQYGDLIAMGVIDPAKVVRSALQNAASVAALMLTTEAHHRRAPQGGGCLCRRRSRRSRTRRLLSVMSPVHEANGAGGSAPKPKVTSVTPSLLLAAAVLGFRATGRDRSGSTLGVLVDTSGAQQHLAASADGAWALVSGALPLGHKPVLLYESAANVLRGGNLNPDGSISYQGGSYVIESTFDGKSWTAKVRGSG